MTTPVDVCRHRTVKGDDADRLWRCTACGTNFGPLATPDPSRAVDTPTPPDPFAPTEPNRDLTGPPRTGEVGNAGWCAKCGQWNPDGEDICLGRLRGVTAACCGHGIKMPYVAFGVAAFDYDPDGFTTIALYDEQAVAYFAHVKAHPDEPFSLGFDMDTWTAKSANGWETDR